MVAKQKPAVYLNKSVRDCKVSVKISGILTSAFLGMAGLSETISNSPLHPSR